VDKWVLLFIVLALPFSTLLTHPDLHRALGVTVIPQLVFTITIEVVLGLLIARTDRWLGVFVIYMAVRAWWTPMGAQPFIVTQAITFGALAIVLLRQIPTRWHPRVHAALVVVGLLQIGVAVLQWAGVDPFFTDAPYVKDRQLPGTIGHGNWLGVYLAMVALLGPALALPLFGLGLALAQSRLGMIALALGVAFKYLYRPLSTRTRRLDIGDAALALSSAFACAVFVIGLEKTTTTWSTRLEIWRLGVTLWSDRPLFGWGPGAWAVYVPSAQEAFKVGVCPGGCFVQAHNDLLQLLFEGGAVAVVILGLWLYEHRQAVRTPQGGALVALAVCSLGMFPWHLAQVAVPALVVVAMATTKEG
jgi:hypothetical protein